MCRRSNAQNQPRRQGSSRPPDRGGHRGAEKPVTFTALPATAAPAGPAQRLCPEPPHRSDRLTSKSVKSGEDEALLTSQSQDEEGDIAKPRDTALKRGGERCRPPGAPGTHSVPWAQQTLRQDWDPAGPATPAPTTLSLPPPSSHKHVPCTACSAPTSSRRHTHCSVHQQSCPGTDLGTRTVICGCRSARKVFPHTNPLSE